MEPFPIPKEPTHGPPGQSAGADGRDEATDLETAHAVAQLLDRDMPVMLAYLDGEERYRYHNRAFRRWLGLPPQQINGRTMREVLGESVYESVADRVREALAGAAVHYMRSHPGPGGEPMRLCVHFVPRHDERRAVTGFYAVVVEHRARAGTEDAAAQDPAESGADGTIVPLQPADLAQGVQELYEGAATQAQAAWMQAAARLKEAIRNGEFQLYAQEIKPLSANTPALCELFVRHFEEERNLMPPGAFFAMAGEYGLMSELDRWAVVRVIEWASERQHARPHQSPPTVCLKLSRDTISDPYFPDFVSDRVARSGVAAGRLCFEIDEADALAARADSRETARGLRGAGCRTMLGGLGRDRLHFDILKEIRFDFFRIDGSIILTLRRSEASLAKLRAITRMACALGVRTVAELVESGATIAKLRELGVDYAQGSAIAVALPVNELG